MYSWRKYISLGLALSFAMILITGIVLYMAPPGSIARWTHWAFLGLEKARWESQHTIFSYLFVIFGIIHLFFLNWKAFLSYLGVKIMHRENRKLELVYALATILVVFSLTLFEVKPVYSVMELGNKISDSWGEKIGKPPFAGVEDMTLNYIANRYFESDLELIVDQLKDAGYSVNSSSQSLEDIAKENGVGTMRIFNSIDLQTKP